MSAFLLSCKLKTIFFSEQAKVITDKFWQIVSTFESVNLIRRLQLSNGAHSSFVLGSLGWIS